MFSQYCPTFATGGTTELIYLMSVEFAPLIEETTFDVLTKVPEFNEDSKVTPVE